MIIFLSVGLSACLYGYLSVCASLPVSTIICLSVSLSACLYAYRLYVGLWSLPFWTITCLSVGLSACLYDYLPVCESLCLFVRLSASL
jgi:hypothetical protein